MSTSHLVVLPKPETPGSPADKIRRLQSEARALAHDHLEQLCTTLADVTRLSGEIAEGGDLYPIGARELARRLAEETAKHAFGLTAILERT
jgi:hypothetical protein